MATPRLPFLWPFLFRATRPTPPRTLTSAPQRGLRSSTRRRQGVSTQRYGTANEPPPQLRAPPLSQQPSPGGSKPDSKSSAKAHGKGQKDKAKASKDVQSEAIANDNAKALPPASATAATPSILNMPAPSSFADAQKQTSPDAKREPSTSSAGPAGTSTKAPPPPPSALSPNPLEAVLNMPAGSVRKAAEAPATTDSYYHENASASPDADDHRPPHISTPRYVHHFDTYNLVKRLHEGEWREDEAITVMKAVRLILADNMELARDGLVSKSELENEAYLFKAACSELKTEVGMRRKAETEKSRTDRGALQHEVDILGQRLGMEAASLKEELKGMVEGRKMAVRDEERSVDSKIQELNYRITVALNSDLRSDVEGVRWIITKRAITALAICVAMVIGALKYASNVWQLEDAAKKKKKANAAAAASATANGGGASAASNGGGSNGAAAKSAAAQEGDDVDFGLGVAREPLVVRPGDNPGYVSLG